MISTHAPLARCDQIDECGKPLNKFQLTHLLRGATSGRMLFETRLCDFNSRTSCEVRHELKSAGYTHTHFNSRTSCEVRPGRQRYRIPGIISTHAPLARCDGRRKSWNGLREISTHAPLARCDWTRLWKILRKVISTHAPLARCDLTRCIYIPSGHFNSRTSCEVRPKN